VQYWHALRAHRLLIVGITLVALLVALIVVETATKRYDAAAHLGINPISNFDNGPVAADGALFQQPADGSSVTVRATEVLSSPRYLDAWKRSRSYTALGPHRDSATVTLSPLSQADIIAVQASAPEAPRECRRQPLCPLREDETRPGVPDVAEREDRGH